MARRNLDDSYLRVSYADRLARLYERAEKASARRRDEDYVPEPLSNLEVLLYDTDRYDNRDGVDYDIWMEVLFAVKTEYWGTELWEDAYALLNEWSSQSPKHSQREFEYKFERADPDKAGAKTVGTMKYHGREALRQADLASIRFADKRDIQRHYRKERASKNGVTEEEQQRNDNWYNSLLFNEKREWLAVPANIASILINDKYIRGALAWDIDTGQLCWDFRKQDWREDFPDVKPPRKGYLQRFDYETHFIDVQDFLRWRYPAFTAYPPKEHVLAACERAGKMNEVSPMIDFYEMEEWDGRKRMERVFIDALGAEDTEYNRAVAYTLFVQAALRAYHPGALCDYVIYLYGATGVGKSKLLRLMFETTDHSYFSDCELDLSNEQRLGESLKGMNLVEIGEGAALRRYTNSAMKAALTRTHDTYRPPYARGSAQAFPRRNVFAVTSNRRELPPDETGNRRYIPAEVGSPGEGFVPGMVPNFKKTFEEMLGIAPQVRAEAAEIAKAIIAKAKERKQPVRFELPKQILDELHERQIEWTPETKETEWREEAVRFIEAPVDADQFFEGKVPDDLKGKKILRPWFTLKQFWHEGLGRPHSDPYEKHIGELRRAVIGSGLVEAQSRHIKTNGAVLRAYRVNGRFNDRYAHGRKFIYKVVGSDFGAEPKGKVVEIDFTDKSGRRRKRDEVI